MLLPVIMHSHSRATLSMATEELFCWKTASWLCFIDKAMAKVKFTLGHIEQYRHKHLPSQ